MNITASAWAICQAAPHALCSRCPRPQRCDAGHVGDLEGKAVQMQLFLDIITGRAGEGRDDRPLLQQQGVEQGGFSHIDLAGDDDFQARVQHVVEPACGQYLFQSGNGGRQARRGSRILPMLGPPANSMAGLHRTPPFAEVPARIVPDLFGQPAFQVAEFHEGVIAGNWPGSGR